MDKESDRSGNLRADDNYESRKMEKPSLEAPMPTRISTGGKVHKEPKEIMAGLVARMKIRCLR